MSLIPFILDLADELHEFSRCLTSGTDINDFGFGLYTGANDQQQQQPTSPQQQQHQQSSSQQQSPRRRTSSFSSTFWLPTKRHHPYSRIKSACCGKPLGDDGGAVSIGVGITGAGAAAAGEKDVPTTPGTPGKAASYSVVNKNGFQVSMNVKQFAPNELSVKTIDNCIVVEGRHDDKEDGHGVISRHFVRKYMLPKGYDPKDVLSTLSSDGILTVKAPPPPPPIAKNDEHIERVVEIQPAPGPAHAVVSAAKDTPVKEQTKKLLSPAARAECQLPEKRQKLDLPQQEQEIKVAVQTVSSSPAPAQPQTPTSSLSSSTESTAVAAATEAAATAAEEIKKKPEEEQTAETDNKEKANDGGAVVAATPANNVETEIEGIEDAKQDAATAEPTTDGEQLKETEEMETDETDTNLVVEKIPETNGDDATTATSESSMVANEPVAESCLKPKDEKLPAKSADKEENKTDNGTKMEVDEVKDEIKVVNNTKTAEENNSKTIENDASDNNNSNNTVTNDTTQNDKNNVDNTGSVPADCANADATPKAAESVANDDVPIKTAVLTPQLATVEIDDVALLKAAVTADASEITKTEEKELLSEPMEGIATSGSPSMVETVECSLFAKSHLGNGNSATLVAAEEVAN